MNVAFVLRVLAVVVATISYYRCISNDGFLIRNKPNRYFGLCLTFVFLLYIVLWFFIASSVSVILFYLFLFLLIIISIKIIYSSSLFDSIFSALYYIIQYLCVFNIVLGITVLVTKSSPLIVYNRGPYYNLAVIITGLYLIVLSYIISNNKLKRFAVNINVNDRVNYIAISLMVVELLFSIFLSLFIKMNFYDGWVSLNVIIFSFLIIIFAYVGLYAIYIFQKSSLILLQQNLENEEITNELAHYKAYEDYTESIRKFRHDYKKMMGTVNILLNNGEIEKAMSIIRDINDKMGKDIIVHKKYCNNPMLDAVLQDGANRSKNLSTTFDALVFIPSDLELPDYLLVEVGTNVIDNALEAVSFVEENKRFIKVESVVNDNWFSVSISNSYSKDIVFDKYGTPKTNKEDKRNHGIGLKNIEMALKRFNGLIDYEVDSDNKIFMITISLPINKM